MGNLSFLRPKPKSSLVVSPPTSNPTGNLIDHTLNKCPPLPLPLPRSKNLCLTKGFLQFFFSLIYLFPGLEKPMEKGTATHSSVLAWEVPCTEELQSMASPRDGPTQLSDWHFLSLSPFSTTASTNSLLNTLKVIFSIHRSIPVSPPSQPSSSSHLT